MDPVTVSITVGRPREEVFAYLADIANHAEFTDHFLEDWHLTRDRCDYAYEDAFNRQRPVAGMKVPVAQDRREEAILLFAAIGNRFPKTSIS